MNVIGGLILKVCRKTYQKVFRPKPVVFNWEKDNDKVSDLIYKLLLNDEPCMVARFGSVELNALSNYMAIKEMRGNILKYIQGKQPQWWWNQKGLSQMKNNAGFFPANTGMIEKFYQLMINDIPNVDILGSWRPEEVYFKKFLENAIKVYLLCLEPYWSKNPWSRALEGKHVLVVHPFAEDIINQYKNHREQLFEDKRVLPKFASLRVVKAVQSIGGESNGFQDWFEALDWMKTEMDKASYDVALIGCGAYGFPLAAHAKRTGHKAVHLGGALQLLFGIRGKRWDSNYNTIYNYSSLFNNYWTHPQEHTKPLGFNKVEDGCYW